MDDDSRFSWVEATAVTLAAVLGNVVLAWSVHELSVPLYFDSLFTFLVVRRYGLASGVVCALGTNTALASLNVVLFPFIVCHLLTVVGAWLVFRGQGPVLMRALAAGLVSAVTNGLGGSFLSFFVFQGITHVNPIDNLVLGLVVTGQSMAGAVFWGGLATNLVDKVLSAGGSFLIDQRMRPSRLARAKSS